MSETKTNEPVKQEGEFTLKGKKSPKKPKKVSDFVDCILLLTVYFC